MLRKQVAAELARLGADLWISPPATGAAPEGIAATGQPDHELAAWTNHGRPALTIGGKRRQWPAQWVLQIAAPFGQDERLLAWARRRDERDG
ncbi:MAG: hypothetical protein R2873_02200 [Caldilineaceae bacterium]